MATLKLLFKVRSSSIWDVTLAMYDLEDPCFLPSLISLTITYENDQIFRLYLGTNELQTATPSPQGAIATRSSTG